MEKRTLRLLGAGTGLLLLLVIITISFFWIRQLNNGDASDAHIDVGESTTRSLSDRKTAADVVLDEFRSFKDCTLLNLRYDEQLTQDELRIDLAPDADLFISFYSDFKTGDKHDGGFESNSVYKNWKWTVGRDAATGEWTVVSYGYA